MPGIQVAIAAAVDTGAGGTPPSSSPLGRHCSRRIDPDGGEIDIAWLLPLAGGQWQLHTRDHAEGRWQAEGGPQPLHQALERLCEDPLGRFWP